MDHGLVGHDQYVKSDALVTLDFNTLSIYSSFNGVLAIIKLVPLMAHVVEAHLYYMNMIRNVF